MTGPLRWVFADDRAHVLTDNSSRGGHGADGYLTVCGLSMPPATPVYTVPPSLDMCRVCVPLPGDDGPARPDPLDVPPPTFPTPTVF